MSGLFEVGEIAIIGRQVIRGSADYRLVYGTQVEIVAVIEDYLLTALYRARVLGYSTEELVLVYHSELMPREASAARDLTL